MKHLTGFSGFVYGFTDSKVLKIDNLIIKNTHTENVGYLKNNGILKGVHRGNDFEITGVVLEGMVKSETFYQLLNTLSKSKGSLEILFNWGLDESVLTTENYCMGTDWIRKAVGTNVLNKDLKCILCVKDGLTHVKYLYNKSEYLNCCNCENACVTYISQDTHAASANLSMSFECLEGMCFGGRSLNPINSPYEGSLLYHLSFSCDWHTHHKQKPKVKPTWDDALDEFGVLLEEGIDALSNQLKITGNEK